MNIKKLLILCLFGMPFLSIDAFSSSQFVYHDDASSNEDCSRVLFKDKKISGERDIKAYAGFIPGLIHTIKVKVYGNVDKEVVLYDPYYQKPRFIRRGNSEVRLKPRWEDNLLVIVRSYGGSGYATAVVCRPDY